VGGKTLIPAELEDTIQMVRILKAAFVQRLSFLWSGDCFQYLQYSRAWGLSYTSGSAGLCINNKKKALHQRTFLLSIKFTDFWRKTRSCDRTVQLSQTVAGHKGRCGFSFICFQLWNIWA